MRSTQLDSGWRKGLTLIERARALNSPLQKPDGVGLDRAQRRLEEWRRQPPFERGSYFERRLAMAGITEDDLLQILSKYGDGSAELPEWESILQQVYAENPSAESLPPSYAPVVEGFLLAAQPLIHWGCGQLYSGAKQLVRQWEYVPFDPASLPTLFFGNLERRLLALLNKTMVLELNIARLQGELEGNTGEERFESFLKKLNDKSFTLKIFQEYPVLARQIVTRIEQWVAFSLEFLRNLGGDWPEIQDIFYSGRNPGLLAEAKAGLGDNHRGGRSTLLCRFNSGLDLVYKPRPLSLDVHFQELLNWLNQRGIPHAFRTLRIVDRTDHGWQEFIAARPCDSADAVHRFYERQGGYLALLYALQATDLHYENVIAAGEHPMLIDLEALFQPSIATLNEDALELAADELVDSVLRVGLLPRLAFGEQEEEIIDVSGLGGKGGQLTPNAVLSLEDMGTDTMRFRPRRLPMLDQKNRPMLEGVEIRVQDYGDAILSGFSSVYEILIENRAELLAENGPLSWFRDDETRVLLRPTEIYGRLLWESVHPDVLRDALDRDCLFDRLWLAVEDFPELEHVIQSECDDLLNCDVPIFTATPSSCNMWSSTGKCFQNFLPQCGLDLARQKLRNLSDDDLSRQRWIIRASLTSLTVSEGKIEAPKKIAHRDGNADQERLMAGAIQVGQRLKQLAIQGKNDVSWVGIGLLSERCWSILPLGLKLYDGISGIIFFLAYLGSLTNDIDYEQLARLGLVTLRRQLRGIPRNTALGGYSGIGGVIYVLCHLSALWGDEELADEAERIAAMVPARIETDAYLDMVSGSAGCLSALRSLYQLRPSNAVFSAMLNCGDHLVKEMRPMQHGAGWLVKAVAPTPLTGYSHGAAGIACALLQLATLSGKIRFREAALRGIEYERGLFHPEVGNWPDLRHDLDTSQPISIQHYGMSWCHGAPGIGLARVQMLEHLDEKDIRSELECALRTTLQQSFGLGHCLCHGDLGNLEFILQAGMKLNDAHLKSETLRLAAITLDSIENGGWLCGTPSHVETPGLMTGLAGIGYELLRLAKPSEVPSVLCLEPPLRRKHGIH